MGKTFGNDNQYQSLASLLLGQRAAPGASLISSAGLTGNALAELFGYAVSTGARTRAEWNNRFEHWERPATPTEEGTIERAHRNVRDVLSNSTWLVGQGVTLCQQGSYFNNTNVRLEADIDLRLVHPVVNIEYGEGVIPQYAYQALRYESVGMTFAQVFLGLRCNALPLLREKFGKENVEIGNKAIRIKGITGSRAEVDVVPAVRHHRVTWSSSLSRFETVEGIAILGKDGGWTINYPDQHRANGVTKRACTANRFKKIVRIFKRLRSDLPDSENLRVPSFLIECLVHSVEEEHFVVETDDRYGRVRRIAARMSSLVKNPFASYGLKEINGVKSLFGSHQGWTHADAVQFVDRVALHLGIA
jgi:hypothetical protein